jgi:hypothetical protein
VFARSFCSTTLVYNFILKTAIINKCRKGRPGAIALFKRIDLVNISRRFDNADLILFGYL